MHLKRTKGLLGFLIVFGLASVALAVWVGIVQIPFHGSTGAAPVTLTVEYPPGVTGIDFGTLLPQAVNPTPAELVAWTWPAPAWAWVKLTNNSTNTASGFQAQLNLSGTPDPALLANVHWNLCRASAGAGRPAGWACVDYAEDFSLCTGTLADLVAAPLVFASPALNPGSVCVLTWVFWLDASAPQSVAGKSVSGTLDVTTIN
jgi:hypothetical protein